MKTNFLTILFVLNFQSAYAALYTVPVAPQLSEYANFELESFNTAEDNGVISIKYKIPKVLTGVEQEVEFIGAINDKAYTDTLSGPNGELTCSQTTTGSALCKVTYKDLKMDKAKALREILKTSNSMLEFKGRIEVMKSFSSDPVGFIQY